MFTNEEQSLLIRYLFLLPATMEGYVPQALSETKVLYG